MPDVVFLNETNTYTDSVASSTMETNETKESQAKDGKDSRGELEKVEQEEQEEQEEEEEEEEQEEHEEQEEEEEEELPDLSDAIDGLHETWMKEGHVEAVSGLEGSDIDAMKLGIHHGSQLGYELGYMRGVIEILSNQSSITHTHSSSNNVSSGTSSFDTSSSDTSSFDTSSCLEELNLSTRCQETILRVIQQLDTFPLDTPASENFQLRLDKLRAEFRKCCSQSKLKNVHNGWRITSTNVKGETKTF